MMMRQGDVLVIRVDQLPRGLEPIERGPKGVVLAEGEKTGHAHAISKPNAAMFRDPKLAAIFLHVTGDEPALLEHEEHSTIALPPGNYQVVRQREYSPEAIRQVSD